MTDEDECRFRGLNLRISDSAMFHLRDFDISVYTLCDMIENSFDCPKIKKTGKPFGRLRLVYVPTIKEGFST